MELSAVQEEPSQQLAANDDGFNSHPRRDTTTSHNNTNASASNNDSSSSVESLTETDKKLRGPLLTLESTPSLSTNHPSSNHPHQSSNHPFEIDGGPTSSSYESKDGDKSTPQFSFMGFLLKDVGSFVADWAYTALIGILVVSYWRVRFFPLCPCTGTYLNQSWNALYSEDRERHNNFSRFVLFQYILFFCALSWLL